MVDLRIELPESFFEEEVRNDFTVTRRTKEAWAVMLDLIAEFQRVCEKHHLTYFADGGTLLGAARHRGFIPWDDDVDLLMPRKDYEVLCKKAKDVFRHPYFWQTDFTDPGSMNTHAKLRNSNTTGILKAQSMDNYQFNQGIFIDIFPADNIPNDATERSAFLKRLTWLRKHGEAYAHITSHIGRSDRDFTLVKLRKYAPKGLLRFADEHNPYFLIAEKEMQRYNNTATKYYANLTNKPDRTGGFLDKSYYEKTVDLPFECLTLPAPYRYKEALTEKYGNWETPVHSGSDHGGVYFDASRSYKEYLETT